MIAVLFFAFVQLYQHPVSTYVPLAIVVHVHVSFSLVQWPFGVYCVVVVVQQMSHHGVVQYQNGAVQPVSVPSGESVLCCIAGPRDLSHYGSWNCFSYRVSDCKVALQCYVILSSLP